MKKSILICHSEFGERESLRLILEGKYNLKAVENGNDCLEELLANSQIEGVLIGVKMPKINSLGVLKQIKNANPKAKVIMIANYQHIKTAEEAVKRGASDYIIEPFSSKDVLEKVEKILE
jgi:DNA-binding NtrC family response regulator